MQISLTIELPENKSILWCTWLQRRYIMNQGGELASPTDMKGEVVSLKHQVFEKPKAKGIQTNRRPAATPQRHPTGRLN